MNRSQKRMIGLLSTAHLILDSYSSFLFQLLPMLTLQLQLTPWQVSWLSPVLMVSSSLLQPVYGMLSDRYLKRSMVVFGPLVAAICLSLLGLSTSLPMLLALVTLGGMGVGAFHPQGAALVGRVLLAYQTFVDREHLKLFADLWHRYDVLRGRPIALLEGGRRHQGTVTGLDDEGALLLRDAHGKVLRFRAGEVTIEKSA